MGAEEPVLAAAVQGVPNPANDAVIVSGWALADGQSVQVTLANIQSGMAVTAEASSSQVRISTVDLPAGLYICHVKTGTAPPVALRLIVAH